MQCTSLQGESCALFPEFVGPQCPLQPDALVNVNQCSLSGLNRMTSRLGSAHLTHNTTVAPTTMMCLITYNVHHTWDVQLHRSFIIIINSLTFVLRACVRQKVSPYSISSPYSNLDHDTLVFLWLKISFHFSQSINQF